jgi:hypothetical protein
MPVLSAIRRWLESAFPESNVRLEEDPTRGVSRFLIEERSGGRARVFELSVQRLNGDPDGVVRYLVDQDVAARLREAPTWRARLGNGDLVEYFQQLQVRCDGKSYTVLQRADRTLVVLDARQQPLARMPVKSAPFDGDIAAVPGPQWHERIRAWRGPDQ